VANNNPNYTVIIKQVPDAQNPSAGGVTVTAPMPDSFMFDSRSEYSPPYSQGLFSRDGALAKVSQAFGARLTSQALTAQLWQGSTETDLNIELEFMAEVDPDVEVRQPILALMKLATASIDPASGMLLSPGPSIPFQLQTALAAGQDAVSSLGATASAVGQNLGLSKFSNALPKLGQINSENANFNGQNTGSSPPISNASYIKSLVKNQISIQIGRYAFFDSVVIKNVQQTYSNQIDALTGLAMHAKVAISFTPLFLVVQSDLDNIFHLNQ
jgi:hypothetical protein